MVLCAVTFLARLPWAWSCTADFDLGALDLPSCTSKYKNYVLGYVACVTRLQPVWEAIEEATVHPTLRFAGRPYRVGVEAGLQTVLEVKTGVVSKAHGVQTALQAILEAWRQGPPPHRWQRLALYLQPTGRYKLADAAQSHRDLEGRKTTGCLVLLP